MQNCRNIDVDNIPFLKNRIRGRNPVANDIIDRNADAFRISLIIQAGGHAAVGGDVIVCRLVQRRRVDPGAHHFRHEIERAVIDDARLADSLDIRLVINNRARGTHLPLKNVKLHRIDSLVESQVAMLVLFSAAAPARFISVHFFAPIRKKTALPV